MSDGIKCITRCNKRLGVPAFCYAAICMFCLISFLPGCAVSKPPPAVSNTPPAVITISAPVSKINRPPKFLAYDKALIQSIQENWYALMENHSAVKQKTGRVRLQFRLFSDGHITDIKVVENTLGIKLALLCQAAVLAHAPYAAWPEDMVRMIGANYRVVEFTFYYD